MVARSDLPEDPFENDISRRAGVSKTGKAEGETQACCPARKHYHVAWLICRIFVDFLLSQHDIFYVLWISRH